jgi:hypothetical protein
MPLEPIDAKVSVNGNGVTVPSPIRGMQDTGCAGECPRAGAGRELPAAALSLGSAQIFPALEQQPMRDGAPFLLAHVRCSVPVLQAPQITVFLRRVGGCLRAARQLEAECTAARRCSDAEKCECSRLSEKVHDLETASAELRDPFRLLQNDARIVLGKRARRLAVVKDARV